MHCLLQHRRVLLLQGPMGWFFDRLARSLAASGQQVHKVHFNGGDAAFYRQPHAVPFTGTDDGWPLWLAQYVRDNQIQAVVVFGQMRPMHRAAKRVADELGCAYYVFEEGYLRPDYVTLERNGVNAYSGMPRDPAFYRAHPRIRADQLAQPTGQRFRAMAWAAMRYSLACGLMWPRYRHHCYHRPIHPLTEACRWLRGGVRKLVYAWRERHMLDRLTGSAMTGRWFLVPLQVHNDSQVRFHSGFDSVEGFIGEVLASFAAHADAGAHLVFKHHPMDRAYTDYAGSIAWHARQLGVAARVHYVHDLHLPTLIRHAKGLVTINSTAGLQSLFHETPVVALGQCFYAIEGLTHQGGLQSFWRAPTPVDKDLYWRFRAYLTEHTQLNASFYARMPGLDRLPQQPAPSAERPAVAQRPAPSRAAPEIHRQPAQARVERAPAEFVQPTPVTVAALID